MTVLMSIHFSCLYCYIVVFALVFGRTISTWSLKRQLSHLHSRSVGDSASSDVSGAGIGWGEGEVGVTGGFRWMNRSHGAFKCRLKFCNYETSARDRTAVIAESESWNSWVALCCCLLSLLHAHAHARTHIHTHNGNKSSRVNIKAVQHQLH